MTGEKRIILTGASSGLGAALAREYAKSGARMILVARRNDLLDKVASEARTLGADAHAFAIDVTATDASKLILARADELLGGVDIVIMNAGLGFPMFASELDADATERVMDVNFMSAVRMIEAVLPRMLASGCGQLVAVSSLASFRGMPGSGPYNASKSALTVFMESIRTELRTSGVRVTTILPGFVRTEMTDKNEFRMPWILEPDDAAQRIVRAIERGRSDYRFPFVISFLIRLSTYAPNWLHDRVVEFGRRRLYR